MEVKLFVCDDCPGCPEALEACDGFDHVHVFDVSRAEDRGQAVLHHVDDTPTLVVVDSSGREIASWRGQVPDRVSLRAVLGN